MTREEILLAMKEGTIVYYWVWPSFERDKSRIFRSGIIRDVHWSETHSISKSNYINIDIKYFNASVITDKGIDIDIPANRIHFSEIKCKQQYNRYLKACNMNEKKYRIKWETERKKFSNKKNKL